MGLFDISPIERILHGHHSTKQRDQYARGIAINFHKWVTKNYWHMGDNEWMETGVDKHYSAEELYELYLKTLNKTHE